MYFELSITMLYFLVMALASLPIIWRERKRLYRSRPVWAAGLFAVISSLSLFWTMNPVRGVLSVGVLGMLTFIFYGALALEGRFVKIVPKIVKVYIFSAVVACGLAIVQFFAGLWFDQSLTLLCDGCVAEQFGFVRPNFFLIEPQFFGSALLAAGLILTHKLFLRPKADWKLQAALTLISLTLILTLSRGAILAFAVGAILLIILHRRSIKQIAKAGLLFAISFFLALTFQGTATVLNPKTDETFISAVDRSVSQLSMGVIDLIPPKDAPVKDESKEDNSVVQPNFDGYVEESTDARTKRSMLAVDRWNDDASTMVFGVGIGSAGMAIHQKYPEKLGAREIVQNEYAEILLERGLVGFMAFAAALISLFALARRHKWLWSVIAAFMVQWIFFSGYPNALHVYLALIIIGAYFILRRDASKPAKQYL